MLDLSPSLQDPFESFGYNDDDNPGREHTLKENVQRQFLKHISWQMSREKLSEIFLADQNSMTPLIFSKDTIRIKRQEKRKLGGRGLTNGSFQEPINHHYLIGSWSFPIPSSKNFHFKEEAKCKSILSFKYEFHLRENQKKNSLIGFALSQPRFETEASGNSEMTQPPTQTFLGVRHAFLPHERLLT